MVQVSHSNYGTEKVIRKHSKGEIADDCQIQLNKAINKYSPIGRVRWLLPKSTAFR